MTECPDTEVATDLVLIFCSEKILVIESETESASMTAPSTTVSEASGSKAAWTSSMPFLARRNSTALTELDPMSNPTMGLFREKSCTFQTP